MNENYSNNGFAEGRKEHYMKNPRTSFNRTEGKRPPVRTMQLEDLGERIFAEGISVSNNARATHLNNNDLIIGTAGAGKTGGYVVPNLARLKHSMVVVDTKGQLFRDHAERMRRHGFRVECIDFVHPERTLTSYNPMDYINRFCEEEQIKTEVGTVTEMKWLYREEDLMSIAKILVPDDVDSRETFWPEGARNVIVALMAYTLEVLPREEQHMGSVCRLFDEMTDEIAHNTTNRSWMGVSFFVEQEALDSDSFAARMYHKFRVNFAAEKCWSSIAQFVANALAPFEYRGNANLFNRSSSMLFPEIGREKTVLFVNVSDTDRAMDHLVNLFYTQLFKSLCAEADERQGGRLAVPVRIILDDFASNVCIPDFDKIISNIRSREIYATVILQSISQLDGMYKPGQARTIINNCDHMLYLGGQDVDTANFFATKAGRVPETILKLPLDEAWFFERGSDGRQVRKETPYAAKYLQEDPDMQHQAS